jgi:hypothetical protein
MTQSGHGTFVQLVMNPVPVNIPPLSRKRIGRWRTVAAKSTAAPDHKVAPVSHRSASFTKLVYVGV